MTWEEINKKLDEILDIMNTPQTSESRRHTFSGGPVGKIAEETYEVLPNGARRIKVNWKGTQ